MVGGEIKKKKKKKKKKREREKIGEIGFWLGGGEILVGLGVFSPLTYQNHISPIWRENLEDFISTQSITFLSPLFVTLNMKILCNH